MTKNVAQLYVKMTKIKAKNCKHQSKSWDKKYKNLTKKLQKSVDLLHSRLFHSQVPQLAAPLVVSGAEGEWSRVQQQPP